MGRLIPKRFHRPGTPPGTLRAPRVPRVERVSISVMDYGPDGLRETAPAAAEEFFAFRDSPTVTWIDITGLHDVELLQRLGEHFGFHPLALEDVLNTGQRPKVEDYDDYYFIVMKLLHAGARLDTEQISLFLGPGYVITLQETSGDVFDPVRERIRRGKGRIRGMGSDYLAYALIDALIDNFFPLLESYGDRLEELELELMEDPDQKVLEQLHGIKRDLLTLRRAAWPEREVIHALERQESGLVRKETKIFLRDCYDHAVQIMDMVETYRDLAAGMTDLYLSTVSNRMNEVMKVLTIMASIFIPLTFLAGIYGMNFDPEASPWNMPELDWYWGYPAALGLMAGLALAMVLYFRRKGWF